MTYIARLLSGVLLVCALSACGLFAPDSTDPPQRAESSRQLHMTLVGGSRLNVSASGTARPVQVCVYVASSAEWAPMGATGNASCADQDQSGLVAPPSRHVIAPDQLLQFWIEAPRTGDIWIVVDADYAPRPARYAPLRMRVNGSGVIHLAVWLDRNGIYNALRPGPVPVAPDLYMPPRPYERGAKIY